METAKTKESFSEWICGVLSLVDASLKIIAYENMEMESFDIDLYPLREVIETIRVRLTSEQRYEFEKQLSNTK